MFNFLLFIAAYLPFQLALNPTGGVDLASIRILILLIFFLWLAQGLKNKKIVISYNKQTFLVSSFLFLNIFSVIAARNTDWSIRKILFLLSIFPIYFVASRLINNKEKMVKVIKALVVSGFIAALIGVGQFMSQFFVGFEKVFNFWAEYVIVPFLGNSFGQAVLKNPSWLVNIAGKTYLRATSFFPDPHMFAFYLGLLIPLSIGLALSHRGKGKSFIIISAVLILADILTFSRGGYIGLFAGLIFFGLFFWHKINKKYKVGAAVLLALALAMLIMPSPISQRFLSSFDLKEGSNQGRLEMWTKAADVIVSRPLLGTGIGNYPLEVLPVASYRDPIYAHNTYLDVAVETGVANGLIWCAILGLACVGFWKKSRKDSLFFFALLSVIIFAAHSLVETAIYSPVVLALFLIIISFNNLEDEEVF